MKRIATVNLYLIFILLLTFSGLAQDKNIEVNSTNVNYAKNRYAFVVGNDHYTDPSVSSLTSCRLDAERMAAFLKSDGGFQLSVEKMTVLLDAKKSEFIKAFKTLIKKVSSPEESTIYFYYSGHGLQGSIVPVDFSKNDTNSLISYDWIIAEIEKQGIAAKVYIIDACYAGSIIETKDTAIFNNAYAKAFKHTTDEKTIAFTATTAFRVTPAGKHESLFTKYLLAAMSNPKTDRNADATISAGELFSAIEAELGVSNAPQFKGAALFPMAKVSAKNETYVSKIKEKTTTTTIISWRNNILKQKTNPTLMAKIIKELEEDTSALAKAKLGYIYRNGIGIKKDRKKALTYIIPAALEQNSFAQYNLGFMYSNGLQFETDKKKAFTYYRIAAANGDPFAQHNLGSYYFQRSKNNNDANTKLALDWFLKAAAQNLSQSQTALGLLYEKLSKEYGNRNKQKQYKKLAFQYYKKAAEQQDAYGQYMLAQFLKENKTGSQEKKKAQYWLKKSCGNNYLRACNLLLGATN